MRNLVLFFTALILGTTATFATNADDKVAARNTYRYNNSFIFVEEGITFAVYPDGEFDFYIDNRIGRNNQNVTFNSGFDYSPFAQYDDFGAVIQVENIPIYYDHYGRLSQVGRVDVNYRNGRVNRLGNMRVFYNNRGFYDYHTGFINVYNRRYIYRPFHSFFARPAIGFRFVRTSPYRRYYNPFRYTFHNPYRFNRRHRYAAIGNVHRYNRVRQERSTIYRNDRRVSLRDNNARRNRSITNRAVAKRGDLANTTRNTNRITQRRSNETAVRNSSSITRGNNTKGTARKTTGRTVQRSTATTRTPQGRNVTKRTVTQTPRSRTVTKSTTQYRSPKARSTQRSVQQAPARSRNTQARSTRNVSSRSSVSKAPTRSTRNVTSRSTSSRSVNKGTSRSSARNNRSATSSERRARQ